MKLYYHYRGSHYDWSFILNVFSPIEIAANRLIGLLNEPICSNFDSQESVFRATILGRHDHIRANTSVYLYWNCK